MPSLMALPGSASTGMARPSTSIPALLATARWPKRCWLPAMPTTAMRRPTSSRTCARRRAEGRPKLYDGRWRDRDPSDAPPDVKPVIRLKAPLTGETVIEDQVQGRVVWQNENLDDLVVLRSDGNPTYMLAVVVDD